MLQCAKEIEAFRMHVPLSTDKTSYLPAQACATLSAVSTLYGLSGSFGSSGLFGLSG